MAAIRPGAVLVLAAAIALAMSGAASAQTAPSPLSAARYTAFDMSYTLEIALDRKATAARIARTRAFCEPLDRVDPLLAVARENCLVTLRIYPALDAAGDCKTRAGCLRTTRRVHVLIGKLIRTLRKANRVIDAEVTDRPCRRALRVRRDELRAAELLGEGFKLLESALRSGSVSTLARAERRIDSGGRISDRLPSTARERRTFRSACGPAPVVAPPPPAA